MRHRRIQLRSRLLLSVFVWLFLLFIFPILNNKQTDIQYSSFNHQNSSPLTPVEMKKARGEYFFRLLRDPATNQIPPNIRERELAFARILSQKNKALGLQAFTPNYAWNEVGPIDVGGRTRALAVDVMDRNIIIAGGVSGGIWKSMDGGSNWELKSTPSQNLSVTSVAQDPRMGFTNTWYYATGEYNGNTARDRGFRAPFYGSGLYKSIDNGETWQMLHSANNPTSEDSRYDYVSRIVISSTTGSIFFASNVEGIFRSNDGGASFSRKLGGWGDHTYTDVAVTSNGVLIATLSQSGWSETPANSPGVYNSFDDGLTWTDITPSTFPTSHERSVIAVAPSNPNTVYILTNTGENVQSPTGESDTNTREDVRFHKIGLFTEESEDRSANLPDFGGTNGVINTQGNYNMVVAVKPDDENFVLIGGTSLFRSTDGFATASQDATDTWIGGYSPSTAYVEYPNHHCDQHAIAFGPFYPNKMWSGHDGGLSYTSDITDSIPSPSPNSLQAYSILWENKNNRYNTTQFYTVAIPDEANDNRIMGGTQDNGTPYFRLYSATTGASRDVSTGDGSHCYFGDSFAYTSLQNGETMRLSYDLYGNPHSTYYFAGLWSKIHPAEATNQLFINPFVVDPNNEDFMYYPAGNALWRNNQLSLIPDFENGTSTGWTQLTELSVPEGYIISTLAISHLISTETETTSEESPEPVLYYGASSSTDPPKIFRLDNAQTATTAAQEISILEAPAGAYVHKIAVNPNDSNEIIIVLSNYNIIGLYHSADGGLTYTAIEGNLEGDATTPGPSLRSATILPLTHETFQGTIYIVATSTGIYSTQLLNGTNTVWTQEGATTIGNVVCEYITSRKSDGRVAVGTHGRGVFIGDINWVEIPDEAKTRVKLKSTPSSKK